MTLGIYDTIANDLSEARSRLTSAENGLNAARINHENTIGANQLLEASVAALKLDVARMQAIIDNTPVTPPPPAPVTPTPAPVDPPAEPTFDLSGVPATWTPGDPQPVVTMTKQPDGTYIIAGVTHPWEPLPWTTPLAGSRTFLAVLKRGLEEVMQSDPRTITITGAATPAPVDPPIIPPVTGGDWTKISVADGARAIRNGLLERATIDGTVSPMHPDHVFVFDGINTSQAVNNVIMRNLMIYHRPGQDIGHVLNMANWLIEDVNGFAKGAGSHDLQRHDWYMVGMKGLTMRRVTGKGINSYLINIRLGTKANGIKGRADNILIEDCVADGLGNFITFGSKGAQGGSIIIRRNIARNIGTGWAGMVAGINSNYASGSDARLTPMWSSVLVEGNRFESSDSWYVNSSGQRMRKQEPCVTIESSPGAIVRNNWSSAANWPVVATKARWSPDNGGNVFVDQ